MSNFKFIDSVGEVKTNESLTAYFTLKGNEEFLKDHFSDFPVMPGVLQLESLKQAACLLLTKSEEGAAPHRLEKIGTVKYGQFVKPGSLLKIFVRLVKKESPRVFFEGRIDLVDGEKSLGRAILADFSLVPVK